MVLEHTLKVVSDAATNDANYGLFRLPGLDCQSTGEEFHF